MMKKILLLTTILLVLTACDDKLSDSVTLVQPVVQVTLPQGISGEVINERFEVKNVTTGRTAIYQARTDLELKTGLYDISYEADVMTLDETDGGQVTRHVQAYTPSVEVASGKAEILLTCYEAVQNDDFVISEIFFTGTLRPNGSQYYGDDYIKIYNNTEQQSLKGD